MPDLYIRNANIATEEKMFPGGIVVADGKILDIVHGNPDLAAEQVIDANHKVLLPGLVDDHVHFNEPGREYWEGYETGSMAAAAGGITTFLEMPLNSNPPTIDIENLRLKRKAVENKSVVDYGNWGGLVDNNLDDLSALHNAGVIGFKAFMSNSGIAEYKRVDDDLLYAGLSMVGKLGNVIGVHAENEYVTRYLGEQLKLQRRKDRAAWFESRPPFCELEAINRACYWADITKGNLHIVHITIPEGIKSVTEAKKRGAHVTAETCPHYLFFDLDDFLRIGPDAKCAPPIRSREKVDELWDCVLDGLVDTIASDHSPCRWEEKAPGTENIWEAWGGISGIQSMLPAILTEGVHKRGLPLSDLVRMMSSNPARIFGLYPQKGSLSPGSDADIVIVDLDKEWKLKKDDLFYKNKHSAYIGYSFHGKVEKTFVRGKLVFDNGAILVQPGYGKALSRLHPYGYNS